MRITKTWQFINYPHAEDMAWLAANHYDVVTEVYDPESTFVTPLNGWQVHTPSPSYMVIKIDTRDDAQETLLCLKLGDKIFLTQESWYGEDHGCDVKF